jgi:hypothetical protein
VAFIVLIGSLFYIFHFAGFVDANENKMHERHLLLCIPVEGLMLFKAEIIEAAGTVSVTNESITSMSA